MLGDIRHPVALTCFDITSADWLGNHADPGLIVLGKHEIS